jgi:hypothetical protein
LNRGCLRLHAYMIARHAGTEIPGRLWRLALR